MKAELDSFEGNNLGHPRQITKSPRQKQLEKNHEKSQPQN